MPRANRGTLPLVHPSVYLDSSAHVIGDLEVGEESSVWIRSPVMGSPGKGTRSRAPD